MPYSFAPLISEYMDVLHTFGELLINSQSIISRLCITSILWVTVAVQAKKCVPIGTWARIRWRRPYNDQKSWLLRKESHVAEKSFHKNWFQGYRGCHFYGLHSYSCDRRSLIGSSQFTRNEKSKSQSFPSSYCCNPFYIVWSKLYHCNLCPFCTGVWMLVVCLSCFDCWLHLFRRFYCWPLTKS